MRDTCDSCNLPVKNSNSYSIINSESGEENVYCVNCLRRAITILSLKKDKNPDEIALLKGIRKFLKYKTN